MRKFKRILVEGTEGQFKMVLSERAHKMFAEEDFV